MTDYSFSHRIAPADLAILREFPQEPPIRVGALAQALGLRVVLATLPMNISGLIQPENDDYVIKVNRFESKERQRFTIAHEIAHYLIHRDQIRSGVIDSVLYRSKLSSKTEAEANRLAADIVMPAQAVKSAVEAAAVPLDDEKVSDLAEKFGVSKQAMNIRIG